MSNTDHTHGMLACGASEVDITPNIGLPMAGYSVDGKEAVGVRGHLFARALYMEDANGERATICVADLHSGTRYLLERVTQATGPSVGITVDRLILCGTHTHSAPGNIYGNTLYDRFSQKRAGLDQELADWLGERIALAIEEAHDRREPALIGVARRPLWGFTRNRSLPAFLANPDAADWNESGSPGEGCPDDLPDHRAKIDPRVTVLTGVRESDRQILAAFGFFGCHTTTLGAEPEFYAPDWAGHACHRARWDLERHAQGQNVVVAVGLSGAGDVNGLRDDLDPPFPQGTGLAHSLGARVGREIASAARTARGTAADVEVTALYAEPTTAAGATLPDPQARLADEWMIGASALAGSEEGRTSAFRIGLAREGMKDDTPVPHHPKAEAAGPLQDLIKDLFDLEPGRVLPLHALRVGSHLFVTVPGEPTTHTVWDIERAVLGESGAKSVTVVGYAGDYLGYFPTPHEYDIQHYEGAQAIFGRQSAPHVEVRLIELLRAGQSGPLEPRPIAFDVSPRQSRFERPENLACRAVDPKPVIERTGNHVHVRWEMDWDDLVPHALDWFVRVERKNGSSWSPLQFMGRDFDDGQTFIHIERDGTFAPSLGRARWHARFGIPAGSDEHGPLSVAVGRRGEFAGFRIEVPEPK